MTPATGKTAHGQFTLTRDYAAAPARVFAAWSDPDTKARWFIGPADWTVIERRLDLRVGGEELLHGRFAGTGMETLFRARYHLVEPDARLVYAYDMNVGPRHHSVSLATVEFLPRGDGTTLRFTEQVVFVDGTPSAEGTPSRERGTAAHLDRIAGVIGAATTR
jgi:uncharacterized protein YndB with AHSA1/START domain